MRRALMLACLLTLATSLAAQSYTVSSGAISGGYTDLTSPTPSNLTAGQLSAEIKPTGFSFTYFGQSYTSFKLGSGGYMIMGSAGTVISKSAQHYTAPGLVIAPNWDHLAPGQSLYPPTSPAVPLPGRCNYTWAAGVLTVEWRNCPLVTDSATGVRMKCSLDTATGVIEFHYGAVPSGCTGSATGFAHSAAISGPTGAAQQEVVDATDAGYINSTGGITTWPVNRYVRFTPGGSTPVNNPPSISVMQGSNTVTNGGTVNVNHNIPLSALAFGITIDDADGDPSSLAGAITNLGSTGIPLSEWASASAGVPYTLNPTTGVFNTAAGVTHSVTLTAHDGTDQTTFTFDIVQAPAAPVPVMAVSDGASVSAGQSAAGSNRDFGSLDIGAGSSSALTITVSNSGSGTLNLGTISMTGDASHFVLDTTGTSGNVGTGASTTFTVSFDPTSAGQKIAQVTFSHDDPAQANPFTFEVTGLGTTPAPVPLLVVRENNSGGAIIANGAAAAGIRAFGSIDLAAPTPTITIFVQNAGTAALALGTPSATTADFTVNAAGFPGSLAGGAGATFTVSFTPATVGIKSANVQFTHNDASTTSPFSFQVTGTATSTGPGPGPTVGGAGGGGGGGGCNAISGSHSWWLLIIALGASLGARTWRRRANR